MNPMQVANKYTQALRAAITDEEELQRTGRAYRAFMEICRAEPNLMRFLRNPVVPLGARRKALDTAMAACDPPPAVAALAYLLLERNRFGLLPAIVTQFERQVDEWLHRVEATVHTAVPISEELRAKIQASLEHFTTYAVRLQCHTDPAIVGGLIVNMHGFSFDFSYRTRLQRLKEKLLSEETLIYGD